MRAVGAKTVLAIESAGARVVFKHPQVGGSNTYCGLQQRPAQAGSVRMPQRVEE